MTVFMVVLILGLLWWDLWWFFGGVARDGFGVAFCFGNHGGNGVDFCGGVCGGFWWLALPFFVRCVLGEGAWDS
ncbi:transmembrane protein, putative [Medicago truncatula]|uniref:Transmembrane protein, putative n=1 Tax=Medicago truncatula TaxID=3880 RepID=A0A072V772_MEDTR|nr:transmembrane protein, putative [Medicago truncatula]